MNFQEFKGFLQICIRELFYFLTHIFLNNFPTHGAVLKWLSLLHNKVWTQVFYAGSNPARGVRISDYGPGWK